MRVLITGAAGFLGRNALLAVPRSWQVVALYRPGNANFLTFMEAHQLHHVQAVACDLTDKHQVEQVIGRVGGSFDSCLALASNTSIPGSIERPIQDLTANVIGLLHMLQCCSFDHFVYLSSGTVYVRSTTSSISRPALYMLDWLVASDRHLPSRLPYLTQSQSWLQSSTSGRSLPTIKQSSVPR